MIDTIMTVALAGLPAPGPNSAHGTRLRTPAVLGTAFAGTAFAGTAVRPVAKRDHCVLTDSVLQRDLDTYIDVPNRTTLGIHSSRRPQS